MKEKENKYLITLISPSHHMMSDPEDFMKTYSITASTTEGFIDEIDKKKRQFSLEFSVALDKVEVILALKVKND